MSEPVNVQSVVSSTPQGVPAEAVAEGLMGRLYRALRTVTADRWFGGVHAGLVVKSLYLRRAVRTFLGEGPKRILDAGCGPDGQLAVLVARKYPHVAVRGVDLQYDQGRVGSLPSNVHLERGDLTGLADAETYDLIYTVDVLEHIHDYATVLERLARALRPGGLVCIHVPSAAQRHWFTATADSAPNDFREHRDGDDHVRDGFERDGLVADLERLGLTVREARWTFGAATSLVKELFSLGERRRVRGIGLMVLLPLVIAVLGELAVPPWRGNGLWLVAMKHGGRAV